MIKDLNVFTVKQFSSVFHLSLPFCLEHELQLWQKLPFPSQHKSQMAVNTERETFKREATFRTKPPFQALNTNPSSHFLRCICFLLQPPVFISPFSHHLVLLPPSPRFLTLCSPAQTLTAAFVKDWNTFLCCYATQSLTTTWKPSNQRCVARRQKKESLDPKEPSRDFLGVRGKQSLHSQPVEGLFAEQISTTLQLYEQLQCRTKNVKVQNVVPAS